MRTPPLWNCALGILIVGTVASWIPGARAAQAPIANAADLDAYLARTPPGASPLDKLSPPARQRVVASFRAGRYSMSDILAELTAAEAADVLALFGLESYVPKPLRPTHRSIGASETPAMTASFAKLTTVYEKHAAPDKVVAIYRHDFEPLQTETKLRALSDGDVALMFRAADTMAGSDESFGAHDLLLDLAELDRRGAAAPAWVVDVYDDLIAQRDFTGARAFRAEHADAALREIPPVRDEMSGLGPTVLTPTGDGGGLIRRSLALDPKAQVVVVAGCHFSKDAALGIESDPTLREAFSQHSVWITPAREDITDPDWAKWNRDHPIAAMNAVERESDWPGIDTWSMPTFYFFRDGHVVSKVIGWETNRDKIVEGFRKAGIQP
jgi:hypothetical protein